MVFCLLPNRKADTYAAVKKLCCLDHDPPIASQCLLVSTIRAEDKVVAVATKVAIQMNCKLGGEPWMIQQKAANTMVIGIDTYHDTGKALIKKPTRTNISVSQTERAKTSLASSPVSTKIAPSGIPKSSCKAQSKRLATVSRDALRRRFTNTSDVMINFHR